MRRPLGRPRARSDSSLSKRKRNPSVADRPLLNLHADIVVVGAIPAVASSAPAAAAQVFSFPSPPLLFFSLSFPSTARFDSLLSMVTSARQADQLDRRLIIDGAADAYSNVAL